MSCCAGLHEKNKSVGGQCTLGRKKMTSAPGMIHLSMMEMVEGGFFSQTTMLLLYSFASSEASKIPHQSLANISFLYLPHKDLNCRVSNCRC